MPIVQMRTATTPRGPCAACGKPLRRFSKKHDWGTRKMHKKCWRALDDGPPTPPPELKPHPFTQMLEERDDALADLVIALEDILYAPQSEQRTVCIFAREQVDKARARYGEPIIEEAERIVERRALR